MANRYAVKSGNWSDVTVWDGGTLPGVGDDVRPNNFTVEIDQDIEVARLIDGSMGAINGNGKFYVSTISGTRTIIADVAAAYSTPLLFVTDSGTLHIIGNVSAAHSAYDHAVYLFVPVSETLEIIVDGNVTGGGTACYGITEMSNSYGIVDITVNGNVSNGDIGSSGGIVSRYGSIFYVTVNGNVDGATGSTGANSAAIWLGGEGSMVTVNGTVTGGTSVPGIYVNKASTILELNGPLIAPYSVHAVAAYGALNVRATGPFYNSPTGTSAILSDFLVVPEGENFEWHCTDDSLYPLDGAPVVLSNFVSDSPPPTDVRAGVSYGIDGTLTGAAVIPSADSVRAGVPVDTEVGTAVVSPSDIWDHEISAGVSAKNRLLATSTDESTAALLEGALNYGE